MTYNRYAHPFLSSRTACYVSSSLLDISLSLGIPWHYQAVSRLICYGLFINRLPAQGTHWCYLPPALRHTCHYEVSATFLLPGKLTYTDSLVIHLRTVILSESSLPALCQRIMTFSFLIIFPFIEAAQRRGIRVMNISFVPDVMSDILCEESFTDG